MQLIICVVSEVDCLLFAGLSGTLQYMSWQWDVYQDQSNCSRDGATNPNAMQRLWWKWRKNIRYCLKTTWSQYESNLIIKSEDHVSWSCVPDYCCKRNMLRTTPTLVSCWIIHLSHFITEFQNSPSSFTYYYLRWIRQCWS